MAYQSRTLTPDVSVRHLFGARLRKWREKRGMSQAQLANLVHLTVAMVSKVETAERRPTRYFAAQADIALDTGGELTALMPAIEQERRRGALLGQRLRLMGRRQRLMEELAVVTAELGELEEQDLLGDPLMRLIAGLIDPTPGLEIGPPSLSAEEIRTRAECRTTRQEGADA